MTSDIADLQLRITFQEDLLETLNARVADQQTEIDQLKFQLNYLNQKFQEMGQKQAVVGRVEDEKPPHY